MKNKELFKKTFSELRASEDKVMEVIQMKNNKKIKHFPVKKLIAIAACIGTILVAGVAANAATDGAVVGSILKITDKLGITYEYQLEVIDDKTVYFFENESNVIALDNEGTYHCEDSNGEAFTIIVDKDGGCISDSEN